MNKEMPIRIYTHEGRYGHPETQGHYQNIPPRMKFHTYVREDVYDAVVEELLQLKLQNK